MTVVSGRVSRGPIVYSLSSQWEKVASNVLSATIRIKSGDGVFETYRVYGESAPVDMTDAIPLKGQSESFTFNSEVDIYCLSSGNAVIRVDL